jgi:hypothetical protein
MKFLVSQDVEAPLSIVWARFTDFGSLEADLRARGATLSRIGDWTATAEGVEWRGEAMVNGKTRALTARVTRLTPEALCLIDSRIGGVACRYEMRFTPRATEATSVDLALELSADTLSARLVVQSLKLARGQVVQRLQAILARQGKAAEAAHRRQADA